MPLAALSWWGKAQRQDDDSPSWHPLPYHMLDVAAVGLRMLDVRPGLLNRICALSGADPASVRPWLGFLIALHDLGKFHPNFQTKVPDLALRNLGMDHPRAETFRHDLGGLLAWRKVVLPVLLRDAVIVVEIGNERLDDPQDVQDVLGPWLTATCGHHGIPPQLADQQVGWPLGVQEAARELALGLARLFSLPPLRLPQGRSLEVLLRSSSWALAGLTNMADWIGSQQEPFRYEAPDLGLDEYWQVAQSRAVAAVRVAGLEPAVRVPMGSLSDLLPKGARASPMQAAAASISLPDEPTLVIIEDSTGSGKTEAALHLVRRLTASGTADGLFFALPTMATSNAMYRRVEQVFGLLFTPESATLVLAHSASHLPPWLFESGGADIGASRDQPSAGQAAITWFRDHRKAALHATVGVGTIDQALVAVLPTRHGQLRLSGLLGKVLVVDEVHAYDDYMRKVLSRLLTFHAKLGGSAILLSATLPGAMRAEFTEAFRGGTRPPGDATAPFPMLTVVSASGAHTVTPEVSPERARFTRVTWVQTPQAALDRLMAVVDAGGCACWIRNTVRDAQSAFDDAVSRLPPDRVHLFHARVCLGHRLTREHDVVRRFGPESTPDLRRGQLLIATQVVEQSLDLDFDLMVSDLAPVDLLIQRAGRVHRHRRTAAGDRTSEPDGRGEPDLVVLAPEWTEDPGANWPGADLQGTAMVYKDRARLWRSQRVLIERGGIRVPEEARELIEAVYDDNGDIPDGLQKDALEAEGERRAAGDLGDYNALRFDDGYRATGGEWLPDTDTPTRLGEPSRTWLLQDADQDPPCPLIASSSNRLAEALSQISLRAGWLAAPPDDERPSSLPQWISPLPLHRVEGPGDQWHGEGRTARGNRILLAYDAVRGIRVREAT